MHSHGRFIDISGMGRVSPKIRAIGEFQKNLVLSVNFHPKVQNFGLKIPHFGEIQGQN